MLVGGGSVHGKAKTCQEVADPTAVHPKETEVADTPEVVSATGLGQAGGGPQVMFDTHPGAVTLAFDVNTKVKHPSAALDVIDGGNVTPEKVPNKVPAVPVPLYIFKTSLAASVLNEVKVTVTTSPGLGQIVVVPVAAVVLLV